MLPSADLAAVTTGNAAGVQSGSMGTTVQLADRSTYEIPHGERGTFAWVREASLISVAYQQVEKPELALEWRKEYERRLAVWNQVEATGDLQAILRTAEPDLLAPLRIVGDVVGAGVGATKDVLGAVGAGAQGLGQAPKAALNLAKWLPVVAIGILVVIGIGLFRGTLGAKVAA